MISQLSSAGRWAAGYAKRGRRVFPVDAAKRPLVCWGEGATTDIATIIRWWQRWPHADVGLSLPPEWMVVDVDRHGPDQDGYADFRGLSGGASVDDVATLQASTPRAGRHLYFLTGGRRFKNGYVAGTAVEIKAAVGFVVLPTSENGRHWLNRAPLAPIPGWLVDVALRKPPPVTAGIAAPLSDDVSVRNQGRAALQRACLRIAGARFGEQDNIRHQQCFYLGGLCSRGDIDEAEALAALTRAALAMPTFGTKPWRDLARRVAASFEAGKARPVPLSITDRFMRDLKARMRLRRPSHG